MSSVVRPRKDCIRRFLAGGKAQLGEDCRHKIKLLAKNYFLVILLHATLPERRLTAAKLNQQTKGKMQIRSRLTKTIIGACSLLVAGVAIAGTSGELAITSPEVQTAIVAQESVTPAL